MYVCHAMRGVHSMTICTEAGPLRQFSGQSRCTPCNTLQLVGKGPHPCQCDLGDKTLVQNHFYWSGGGMGCTIGTSMQNGVTLVSIGFARTGAPHHHAFPPPPLVASLKTQHKTIACDVTSTSFSLPWHVCYLWCGNGCVDAMRTRRGVVGCEGSPPTWQW